MSTSVKSAWRLARKFCDWEIEEMPKCCYDCKNLDNDYEWDGEDETIFF